MDDGTIRDNTASSGGGVFVGDGIFSIRGGIISGNIATSNGGGVAVNAVTSGGFFKTGGVITGYSSDPDHGNVVRDSSDAIQSNKGHAVYASQWLYIPPSGARRAYYSLITPKIKETTTGPEIELSCTYIDSTTNRSTATGSWDNFPSWLIGTWYDIENVSWVFDSKGGLYYENNIGSSRNYFYVVISNKLLIEIELGLQEYDIAISADEQTVVLSEGTQFPGWRTAGPGMPRNELIKK